MTRWGKRVQMPVVLGLLFGFALASIPALASPDDRLAHLRHNQNEVAQRIARLGHRGRDVSTQVKTLDAARRVAKRRVAVLDGRLDSLDGRIGRLQTELIKARNRIVSIHGDLLDTQAHLVRRTKVFTKRARAIYEAGPNAMVDGLLSSQNFGDLVDRYTYYQSALANDKDLLDQISGLRNKMATRQRQAERQEQRLSGAKTRLIDTRQRVATARRRREDVLAQRRQAVADKQGLLREIQSSKSKSEKVAAELDSEVNQVKHIIAAAEAAAAAQREQQQSSTSPSGPVPSAPLTSAPPPPSGGGQLSWPVSGPVTSGFGMRVDPVTHQYQLHAGIDIGAGYGAPVGAADDGTVIYAGTMSGYGRVVVIDHGGGLSTLYGHLSAYGVAKGQEVSRGSQIANVGCTGFCTGPHLHFEVRVNGDPVDPMPYLQ